MKKDYIKNNYANELELIKQNKWSYKPFDNYETPKSIFLKIIEFFKKYNSSENLVIISHEGICRKILYTLEQIKNISLADFENFINNADNNTGSKILEESKKIIVDQNYFYCYNNKEIIRI